MTLFLKVPVPQKAHVLKISTNGFIFMNFIDTYLS